MLACLLAWYWQKNYLHEFTESCFVAFDLCSRGIANFIFSREFHVAIPWMDLSKIFDKTVGGQYNSISLHFGRLQWYVFQSLDVRASENKFFNWISCNKGLKAKISCFFCFFCLTPPPRLERSRSRYTASFQPSILSYYLLCFF